MLSNVYIYYNNLYAGILWGIVLVIMRCYEAGYGS